MTHVKVHNNLLNRLYEFLISTFIQSFRSTSSFSGGCCSRDRLFVLWLMYKRWLNLWLICFTSERSCKSVGREEWCLFGVWLGWGFGCVLIDAWNQTENYWRLLFPKTNRRWIILTHIIKIINYYITYQQPLSWSWISSPLRLSIWTII